MAGNATTHTISNSNFTMLTTAGGVVGGATDVAGTFDDSKICSNISCTQIAMTLASNQPFFGLPWTAKGLRVFSEGSYTFDTACTLNDITNGITNCGGSDSLALNVGPGQFGVHMLFDYGAPASTSCGVASCDIDVAVLWNLNSAFGDPIYNATDPSQTPTKVWNLASIDGNGDGIRGIPMVDGPFPGFNANFNLDTLAAVPLPAAVWLFASGLMGLFAISRRKHAA